MKNDIDGALRRLALLGVCGSVFYFLHVIAGTLAYPGYDSFAQAVSDLTADGAPSQKVARAFTTVYGLFTVTACTVFCLFYRGRINVTFRRGIFLFALMNWISGVGYALFPLSQEGIGGTFQDIMHLVVTAAVVLLTIASLVLIAAGALKSRTHRVFGILTIVSLAVLGAGSMAVGIVPREYFGIAERFSVFIIVVYTAMLSVFTWRFREE